MLNEDEIKAMVTRLDAAMRKVDGGEYMPGKEGWVYRDIPWMTDACALTLFEAIGETEFAFLAFTRRIVKGEAAVRGQILISPKGIENMKAWLEKQKN